MGTDIHPIVQVRKSADSPWENVEIPKSKEGWGNLLDSRNYDVFAILANVRNGRGFAGIKTSEGFPYISDERGIPEDAGFTIDDDGYVLCPIHEDDENRHTDDFLDCEVCYWTGYHSHTWVTLKEILDYDWMGEVVHYGVISETDYLIWKEANGAVGIPDSYSGMVSGSRVVVLEEEDYNKSGKEVRDPQKSYYIRFRRGTPRAWAAGNFFTEGIEWLKTLGEPEDVRIIMGFDS